MKLLILIIFLLPVAVLNGCGGSVDNVDWATNLSGEANGNGTLGEVQSALDTYADALANKDRNAFLAVVDADNSAYAGEQDQLFTNLEDVPFLEYAITATSMSDAGPDTATVKAEIAYTLVNSFEGLPIPERAAFTMVKKEDGWKLSGDATEQALGKQREAGLERFGKISVTEGEHVIVLSHPDYTGMAAQIRDLTDAAYPKLQDALPGLDMPKVPVKLFSSKSQIDATYPGVWQEWTGGAARPLGDFANQGGEIIIDAGTFSEAGSIDDGYNGRLLAHELTHVALFPESGVRTPPFMIEGLADYVAGMDSVVLLRQKLRSGESFSPSLSDLYQPSGFSTLLTTEAATLAYEEAYLAVEYLVLTYGNEAVLDLLREFKDRSADTGDQGKLVDEIFLDVLGVSWAEFENGWRDYVLRG